MAAFQSKDIAKAISILESLAANNDANAQEALVLIFYNDKNGYQDKHKALKWGIRAANAGRLPAMKTIAKIYAGGEAGATNETLAQKWYQKAADTGDNDAAYQLFGLKMKTQRLKNLSDALAIPDVEHTNKVTTPIPKITLGQPYKTRSLSGLGNPYTAYDAGGKHHNAGNYARARSYWLPFANAGLADHQLLVAKAYFAEENYKQALIWLKRTASADESNNDNLFPISEAEYYLGVMYDNGLGATQDIPMAVAWYHLATEHLVPHKKAAGTLGIYYYDGTSIPQSDNEAHKFLRMGDQTDMVILLQALLWEREAKMFKKVNQGTTKDFFTHRFTEATKLLKDAATKDNGEAQYRLGVRYLRGEHVPQSKPDAVKWFKAAKENKFHGAEYALQQLGVK